MMDFVKDCRVMVERLSWEDLQFHKLSAQNSEMSLVNLQRVAIKEEMKTEEDCNYDHLSKDDLINEVKARDDRVRELEAERNVLISKMAKERVKTSLTINKQIDEIERLNRVNNELERRIKDLMEKSGIDQLANDELVKSEPVENDSGINGQELSLPIVMHSVEAVNVQGMLGREDISEESPDSEPQYVAEVGNANNETEIVPKKSKNVGFITRSTNVCVPKLIYSDNSPLCVPSPKLEVENQLKMPLDTTMESDSSREPLENNNTIIDSYRKSQSVSTEGETDERATRPKEFRVPELNVEVEKHLDLSLGANVESDSLELAVENDLDDNQSRITLTGAKKTDRQNRRMVLCLPKLKRVDPMSVPVCVPKPERNPNEPSELTSVSMEINSPEVPVEVGNNSSVSNLETFQEIAPKNSESLCSEIGKLKKKRSTRIKYSADYKRGPQRHIKKGNEEKRFKCNQCDYASTMKSNLIAHQHIHSGEKPFKCEKCDYRCTVKSNLIIHQRIHSGEKPFKCEECDYKCTQKISLIAHQHIHSGEKPFKCDQCDYASTMKSNLIAHQHIHSGEKPFTCDLCNYGCTKKYNLIIHQRIHSGEKPFKCEECDYKCTQKISLIAHQHIHSGEKPFRCNQCDYASTMKSNLINHQRIHSGEKPFKCEECDYASTMKSNLINHQRIHSGEKPFKCDQCDYACKWKGDLTKHERRSHMND